MASDYPAVEIALMFQRREYETIMSVCKEFENSKLNHRGLCILRNSAQAALRAGNISDAIMRFEKLIAMTPERLRCAEDFCELGAARFIEGVAARGVEQLLRGLKCNYGDGAGNMTPALLLFYLAVRLSDTQLQQHAVKEIEARLSTGWARNWPAPLGRYLLAVTTFGETEAEIDLMHAARQPDQRCRLQFYGGVMSLDERRFGDAAMYWQAAVDVPKQRTTTTEYVFACHESNECRLPS